MASVTHLRMARGRSGRQLLGGLALMVAGLLASVLAPVRAEAEGPATFFLPRAVTGLDVRVGVASQVTTALPDPLSVSFAGLVYRDGEGDLPSRVRAVGELRGELLNCGTADVTLLDNGLGFYRLTVVSGDVRAGCPLLGDEVRFRLLYGSVDDGVEAIPSRDTTFAAGNTATVSLTPSSAVVAVPTWSGDVSGSVATLTWRGDAGVATADALALLDRPVVRAWRWDAATRRMLVYAPGGPAFLQTLGTVSTGDVIGVRFR